MAREVDGSCVGNRLQINIQLHGGRQLGLKKKKTAENDTAERLGYQHLVLVSGGVCFIQTFHSNPGTCRTVKTRTEMRK